MKKQMRQAGFYLYFLFSKTQMRPLIFKSEKKTDGGHLKQMREDKRNN